MRKQTIILLFAVLTLLPSLGNTEEITGGELAKLSNDLKLGFILGWVYAGEKGIKEIEYYQIVLPGAFDFMLKKTVPQVDVEKIPIGLPQKDFDAEMRKALHRAFIKKVWEDEKKSDLRPGEFFFKRRSLQNFKKQTGIGFPGVAMGQILGMTDQVYSDPRVRNWEISKIMPLVTEAD